MNKYSVKFERDQEGWWVASVKGIPGCQTQGRTIEQARGRIRETLEQFIEDAASAKLTFDIVLPEHARSLINNVHSTRKRAEEEAARLQRSTSQAVKVLTEELGVSVRDAGVILGLSHQRVHQLRR